MKVGTQSHPKFLRLKRMLDLPTAHVAGLLELLWMLPVVANRLDGDLTGYDATDIAAYLEWSGDPNELVEHLTKAGWMDAKPDGGLVVHDYEDHCPEYVKKRAKRASEKDGSGRRTADSGDRTADSGDRTADSGDRTADSVRSALPCPPAQPIPFNSIPTNPKKSIGQPPTDSADADTCPPAKLADDIEPPSQDGQASDSRDGQSSDSRRGRTGKTKRFDAWWAAYPRKVKRQAAEKAYVKAVDQLAKTKFCVQHDPAAKAEDFLLEAVQEFAAAPICTQQDAEFIPHPTTWLNDGRYDDNRECWKQGDVRRKPVTF